MGSSSDWETMQAAADTLDSPGDRARGAGHLRASHAGSVVRICRLGARARPQGHHRRCGRRGAPAGHDGGQDLGAGARRAGAVEDARAASIRCCRSRRCRAAFRSPPSPSARRAPGMPRCSPPRSSPTSHTEVRLALDAFRIGADRGGARQARPAPALKFHDVGIVGAGQLGRMMALAGVPLGAALLCSSIAAPTRPAPRWRRMLIGELEDPACSSKLAARSDVLTFDWENISGERARTAREADAIRPPRAALEVSQDRLREKALFARLKIPVAAHAAVDSQQDLARAVPSSGCRASSRPGAWAMTARGSASSRADATRRRLGAHGRPGPDL